MNKISPCRDPNLLLSFVFIRQRIIISQFVSPVVANSRAGGEPQLAKDDTFVPGAAKAAYVTTPD